MSSSITQATHRRITSIFTDVDPADRAQYIHDNAESMLLQRDRIIDRQRERLRILEARGAGFVSTIARQAQLIGELQQQLRNP